MENLSWILCTECKKPEVWEKIINNQFCWSCFGITNKEEAMSVRCIGGKIVKSEDIKPEKPKRSVSLLTTQTNVINIYLVFNGFIINNFKIRVSFFIVLGLGFFIYYFFKKTQCHLTLKI